MNEFIIKQNCAWCFDSTDITKLTTIKEDGRESKLCPKCRKKYLSICDEIYSNSSSKPIPGFFESIYFKQWLACAFSLGTGVLTSCMIAIIVYQINNDIGTQYVKAILGIITLIVTFGTANFYYDMFVKENSGKKEITG